MSKKVLMFCMALLFNGVTGAVFGAVCGIPAALSALGMNAVAVVVGALPVEPGILRAGVYKEIWTGELVKYLRRGLEATWLEYSFRLRFLAIELDGDLIRGRYASVGGIPVLVVSRYSDRD